MEFYELIQAVHTLDLAAFTERFRHPFLLEDDPEEQRSTVHAGDAVLEADEPAARRVFEVVRRDGTDGAVVIGRSPTADVRIDLGSVSSRHAQLKKVPGTWMVTDLHSTNGTRIGDSPAPPGVAIPLRPGSKLRVGPDVSLTFFEPARVHQVLKMLAPRILRALTPGTATPEGTFRMVVPRESTKDAPHERPLSPSKGTAAPVTLVARCDPLPPFRLEVGREVKVGRTDDNDMVLPHPAVSRRHATLTRDGDVVLVTDLGSANGTFLGDQRVRGAAFALPGDAPVVVGPFEIRIEAQAVSPLLAQSSVETTALRRDRLEGTLETMPLADMLQAAELNRRSGTLRLEAPDGTHGELAFADGVPLRASFGTLRGEDAAIKMLALKKGRFVYGAGVPEDATSRDVKASFMRLLMEASRVADERSKPVDDAAETWVD